MKLLVIPARGGSERIPRKNLKPFAGRPIIEWSIETALAADLFDHVVVSTDDSEIAETARRAGAEVPFMRPAALADAVTATIPVVAHAVEACTELYGMPALTCCLYPTAPFVRPEDLHRAHDVLVDRSDVDLVMTVAPFEARMWRAFTIEDCRLRRIFPDYAEARSQDLPAAYIDAGQFYFARSSVWTDPDAPFATGAHPLVLAPGRAHDIDLPSDWERAERMFLESGEHRRSSRAD